MGLRAAGLVLAFGLSLGWVLAEDPAPEKTAKPAEKKLASLDFSQRPVAEFLRSPAGVLLTPAEKLEYMRLDPSQRVAFLKRFWDGMAQNCPEGRNPARDEFLRRVEEALAKFTGEAGPGWVTDRGNVYIVLGPPQEEKTAGEGDGAILTWTYSGQDGQPAKVMFHRSRLAWNFQASEPAVPGDFHAFLAPLAQRFRGRSCQLSPDEQKMAALVAWRKQLLDIAGQVIVGAKPSVLPGLELTPAFYPAADEATLTVLTVGLDKPLAPGQKVVALMVSKEDTNRFFPFGSEGFPFEIRPVDQGVVAQASRSLPPGQYILTVGLVDEKGDLSLRYAGEQLVVRLAQDNLRLTVPIVAYSLKPNGDAKSPFTTAGFDITSNPWRTFFSGSSITLFYEVLGAKVNATGKHDLKTTLELQFNSTRSKAWVKVGPFAPIVKPNQEASVQAQEMQFPASWPAGEYKFVIQVVDNTNGATVTQEALFRLKPKN